MIFNSAFFLQSCTLSNQMIYGLFLKWKTWSSSLKTTRCLVRIMLLKGIDDLWSLVVFFSWYFPIGIPLPFRYYLHLSINMNMEKWFHVMRSQKKVLVIDHVMLLHEMQKILWFSYARVLRHRKLLLWHFSYHQRKVDQVVFIISSFFFFF